MRSAGAAKQANGAMQSAAAKEAAILFVVFMPALYHIRARFRETPSANDFPEAATPCKAGGSAPSGKANANMV